MFYYISNCQTGLTGISFGNFLIKKVVDVLSTELPRVRNFVTLSPVPGFCRWIGRRLADDRPEFLTDEEAGFLNTPDWPMEGDRRTGMERTLMRLAAGYLTTKAEDGLATDPVARFHLGNGASIERINWAGDLSQKGLRQSAGIMVNYRYNPDKIVANHEAYISEGVIAHSAKVKSLMAGRG